MRTSTISLLSLLALVGYTVVEAFVSVRTPVQPNRHALSMANPLDTLFAVLKEGKVGLVKSIAGDYDAIAIRNKMDTLIEENPVLMFRCVATHRSFTSKAVLDGKGAKYKVLELDQMGQEGKAIRAEMGSLLGRTSVPAIWINKEFIGGCNDGPLGGINGLNNSNKLDALLKSAGAM
eukprot:scaffold276_cov200-Alexandrium_tamarense.AAC.3